MERFYTHEEVFGEERSKITWFDKLRWGWENLPKNWRNLLRRLFWPKCDLCRKRPAYFEYYQFRDGPLSKLTPKMIEMDMGAWIYVCWDCNIHYDLNAQGCVE